MTARQAKSRSRSQILLRKVRPMKTCSYCGKQYPDDVEVCVLDQHPLGAAAASTGGGASPNVTCPQCGAADDFTQVVDFRGSFSLPAFLFGGFIAVMFRNAGKARRVRCNKCEARFYVSSPLSKISRVIFWLLVTPGIICLAMVLILIIHTLFAH
jgi:hypothetical protein